MQHGTQQLKYGIVYHKVSSFTFFKANAYTQHLAAKIMFLTSRAEQKTIYFAIQCKQLKLGINKCFVNKYLISGNATKHAMPILAKHQKKILAISGGAII